MKRLICFGSSKAVVFVTKSKAIMEDDAGGFNDRVDKVFGSISSSSFSSSSSSSSLWSLTDAQIERRVWNRDNTRRDDNKIPVSSSFDNFFNRQTKSLQDDDWDIRSSIGLDSTLDNEEEEDAYDKMAQGRENDGDRLFMKDVTHHGPYLNSHNVLPTSVHNHHVEKEDDHATDDDEPMLNAQEVEKPPCVTGTVPPPDDDDVGIRIKSILKRKSDELAKPAKRVRFDPTCKNNDELQSQGSVALPKLSEENGERGVPDYILNPSKYTRYDFHDFSHDDVDKGSNRDVYLGFLEQVKKSKHVGLEQKSSSAAVLPKSVVFIPRKKQRDAAAACNSVKQQLSSGINNAIGIAAALEERQQQQEGGEISEMQEEDESHDCTKARFQTPCRRYRSKMEDDDNVC